MSGRPTIAKCVEENNSQWELIGNLIHLIQTMCAMDPTFSNNTHIMEMLATLVAKYEHMTGGDQADSPPPPPDNDSD